ncbi:MAG: YcjX family protein [Amphritea sp.]
MDTKGLLSNAFQNVSDKVERSYDLTRQRMHRLTSDRICVGVTGLSRSGKSTFITSLINQLIQHERSSLSGFSASLSGQFLGVKTHKLEDTGLNAFPYDEAMAELAATPSRWPESTVDISGCLLELKFKNRKGLLGALTADTRSIFVEIRQVKDRWEAVLDDLDRRKLWLSHSRSACLEISARKSQHWS